MVQVAAAPARARPSTTLAPHIASQGCIAPGVAGLLAEPDQHVVDEDHADRQREGRRARLLLAAEREREPEQAEHQAGGGDRELLVPLDREAAPLRARLALRAELGHLCRRAPAATSRGRPSRAAASCGRGRTRRPAGPSPSSGTTVRLYARGSAPKKLCWLPGPSSTRTIWRSRSTTSSPVRARISFDSAMSRVSWISRFFQQARCRARCPGRRASCGPAAACR